MTQALRCLETPQMKLADERVTHTFKLGVSAAQTRAHEPESQHRYSRRESSQLRSPQPRRRFAPTGRPCALHQAVLGAASELKTIPTVCQYRPSDRFFPQLHSNSNYRDLRFPQVAARRSLPQSRTARSTRGTTAAPHPAAHGNAFETLREDGDGRGASSLRLPGNSVLSVTIFEKKKLG